MAERMWKFEKKLGFKNPTMLYAVPFNGPVYNEAVQNG